VYDWPVEWPLLAPLSDIERRHVLGSAIRRRYSKGESVVREGEPADALHLVASGRLAVTVSLASGERVTLNVLSPGQFFGELSLVRWKTGQRRSATITVLEPAETLALRYDAFEALCQGFPAVEQLLVASLATRVDDLSRRLLEAMYVGLDRRVYRCLLRMLDLYREGGTPAHIPLTQEQLADLVGGSRPSVNQVLRKLAEQHVVELHRGGVRVLDPSALRAKAHI
jgi:CRP-like cAMP-binding protein